MSFSLQHAVIGDHAFKNSSYSPNVTSYVCMKNGLTDCQLKLGHLLAAAGPPPKVWTMPFEGERRLSRSTTLTCGTAFHQGIKIICIQIAGNTFYASIAELP
jgi:hypothetical protein